MHPHTHMHTHFLSTAHWEYTVHSVHIVVSELHKNCSAAHEGKRDAPYSNSGQLVPDSTDKMHIHITISSIPPQYIMKQVYTLYADATVVHGFSFRSSLTLHATVQGTCNAMKFIPESSPCLFYIKHLPHRHYTQTLILMCNSQAAFWHYKHIQPAYNISLHFMIPLQWFLLEAIVRRNLNCNVYGFLDCGVHHQFTWPNVRGIHLSSLDKQFLCRSQNDHIAHSYYKFSYFLLWCRKLQFNVSNAWNET
jgi:hypothetical protein